VDGWMGGWVDGWVGGWMDEWMEYMGQKFNFYVLLTLTVSSVHFLAPLP
jgi:hypothetical protein